MFPCGVDLIQFEAEQLHTPSLHTKVQTVVFRVEGNMMAEGEYALFGEDFDR
jgi:hypothetical protein